MHYLTLITCALILGSANLERTVAEEKPSNKYLFYPILSFDDMPDKESVSDEINNGIADNSQDEATAVNQNAMELEEIFSTSIMVNEISEQPEEPSEEQPESFDEASNSGLENHDKQIDETERVAIDWIINLQEPLASSRPDFEINTGKTLNNKDVDDDDDEICHNETSYTTLELIEHMLIKTNPVDQLLEESLEEAKREDIDTVISKLLNNQNDAATNQDIANDKKQSVIGDKINDVLLSAILESLKQPDGKEEGGLSETAELVHGNETDMDNLNKTRDNDTYLSEEILSETEPENKEPQDIHDASASDEDTSSEDIGKLLAEADLFDYQLFADVYIQQVVECAFSTVNVSKLVDLPDGIFEAINLVHNDIINKLT